MAGSRTYRTKVVVLDKTKLKETDLILTMLDERGRQVRAVAKGARKPGGRLAARCELFCTVDMLLAHGRSLDVVSQAEPGRSGSPLALATYEMGQTLAACRLRERCRAPCLFHLLVINQLRSTSDIQDVRRRTCAKDAAGATSCLQSLAKLACSCVNV